MVMDCYLCLGLILSVLILHCDGLKCWHCENERSNYECMRNGRLQVCLANQLECQNEIRSVAGSKYYTITKRCKQNRGCETNRDQNELHPTSYACEKNNVVNVCWCCCNTDNCNGPKVYCLEEKPKCEGRPPVPANGIVICNKVGTELGTTCIYRCRGGYKLVGTKLTTCVRTGFGAIWSATSPPICEGLTCPWMPVAPLHGSISCSDGANMKSQCQFSCDENYVLVGSKATTCSHLGIWSNPEPLCVVPTCPEQVLGDNLMIDCNDGFTLGSVCRFSCPEGYKLQGRNEIACGTPVRKGVARWERRFPTCEELPAEICPKPDDSTVKNVECTKGRNLGSECTYSCAKGEYMISSKSFRTIETGVLTIECLKNNTWSDSPPSCRTIICPFLRRTFLDGERRCSQHNSLGSECTYTCDPGYLLTGPQSITCVQGSLISAGVWSGTEPMCELDESTPGWCGPYDEIDGGDIDCNHRGNGTHWMQGTACRLTCSGNGFQAPTDLRTITCDANGGWMGTLCCERCLSGSRLDIIVLMDSSLADDIWEVSKSFSPDFALFLAEKMDLTLNFVMIPYSTNVHEESVVRADDIDFDNYQTLETLTQSLRYDGSGDSNTGKALQYVIDTVLDDLPEASVPVIVILTNRAPADQELAVNATQLLRNQFIHIRIVPFTDFYTAEAGSNREIFATLTGNKEGAVVEDDSVETFYETATSGIVDYEMYCTRLDSTCRA